MSFLFGGFIFGVNVGLRGISGLGCGCDAWFSEVV